MQLGREGNFMVEHFQVIGSLVDSCGFLSGLSSFFIICLGVEVVRESLRKMLMLPQRS